MEKKMSIIQKMGKVTRTSGAFVQPPKLGDRESAEVIYIHLNEENSDFEERSTFCISPSRFVLARMLKVGDVVYLEWNSDESEKTDEFSGAIAHVTRFSLHREIRGAAAGENYARPAWFKAGFGLL
jgi:hypothetical protein